jgi:hypothetical protein
MKNNNNVVFKIKELRIVGLWSYDSKFDSCAICKKKVQWINV